MSDAPQRHADLVTLVFEQYKKSLDLELALDIVPMSDEERGAVEADAFLSASIKHAEAEEREAIIGGLRKLAMHAESEGVQLSALEKYGKMLYPKRFKNDAIDVNLSDVRVIGREKLA